MLTEFILISAGYATYKNLDKLQIRRKWKQICFSKGEFTNKLGKSLKILQIRTTEYGHIIKIELPYSLTFEKLKSELDIFKEGLGYNSIQLDHQGNIVTMYCINKFNFKEYEPIKLPANKILIGDSIDHPIIVDMNKFPHMLVGGDTGTGKSRILLLILTNLIKYCNNVDIYLLQVRKNDLGVFKNCKQIKANSTSLEEVLISLEYIDSICRKRENLIDNTKGYYNINDYNKYNKRLNYIYVVIEEFSMLNISRGDNKEIKKIKSTCLMYIKNIVNVGRSSGVFLITSLQKPTNDSIPSDIKSQLCTRISLRISDSPASIVVLGNSNATKLQEREFICRTLTEEKGFSYTIDHKLVIENIKNSIVENKNTEPKPYIPATPDTIPQSISPSGIEGIMEVLHEINK